MIKYIKELTLNCAKQQGFHLETFSEGEDLKSFISKLRNSYTGVELIRVGSLDDGGYLLPSLADNIKYCFSPGVADNADFEEDIYEKYKIKSFLADASVDGPPKKKNYLDFEKKFVGNNSRNNFITMDSWIDSKLDQEEAHLLMQMDIEGGEYDALLNMSDTSLQRFDYLLIEFHLLQRLYYRDFLQLADNVFEKLFKNFSIVHMHPNNCDPLMNYKDVSIPNTLEISFVNKNLIPMLDKADIDLPHKLDQKNIDKDDFILPEMWWKENSV